MPRRQVPARPPARPPLHKVVPGNATLRLQWVDCGKARCRKLHGPYWYAVWAVGHSRLRTVYIGSKERLDAFLAAVRKAGGSTAGLRFEAKPTHPHAAAKPARRATGRRR